MDADDASIADAAARVRAAERIAVLTGAGISTDSGIPDFRGPNGLWTKDPTAEKLSNIRYYLSDPEIRREAWRRRAESTAPSYDPNDGHRALVDLEWAGRLELLVTQNIDGLHAAAGTSPELLVEIHGTNRDWICLDCDARGPMGDAIARVKAGDPEPACETCGGILKSATISFGQSLVTEDLQRADAAARACDLMLAVGSTLGVYPIANMVPLAKSRGAEVVIINGSRTEMDDLADVVVRGSISEVLPAVVAAALAD